MSSSLVLKPAAIRSTEETFCNICQNREDTRLLWAHEDIRNVTKVLDDFNHPVTRAQMFHHVHKECQKEYFEISQKNNCVVCRISFDLNETLLWKEKAQKASLVVFQQIAISTLSTYINKIAIAMIASVITRTSMMSDVIPNRMIDLAPIRFLCAPIDPKIFNEFATFAMNAFALHYSNKLSNILLKKIMEKNNTLQDNDCLNFLCTLLRYHPNIIKHLSKNPNYKILQIILLEAVAKRITHLYLGRT